MLYRWGGCTKARIRLEAKAIEMRLTGLMRGLGWASVGKGGPASLWEVLGRRVGCRWGILKRIPRIYIALLAILCLDRVLYPHGAQLSS